MNANNMVTVFDGRDNSYTRYTKEEYMWRLKWERQVEETCKKFSKTLNYLAEH